MNIEHEYMERTGEYKAFPGEFVWSILSSWPNRKQSKLSFMSEENTARVKRQKEAPIFVIVGGPPYNMGQVNENDQNKNRKYPHMDERVRQTYSRDSRATLRNKLSDPYVKAFRFASDRIVQVESSVLSATTASWSRSPSMACGNTCARSSPGSMSWI